MSDVKDIVVSIIDDSPIMNTPADLVSWVCSYSENRNGYVFVYMNDANRVEFVIETQPINVLGGYSNWFNYVYNAIDDKFNDYEDNNTVLIAFDKLDFKDDVYNVFNKFIDDGLTHNAVFDRLIIDKDRWISVLCEDKECCPPGGQMVRSVFVDSVFVDDVEYDSEFFYVRDDSVFDEKAEFMVPVTYEDRVFVVNEIVNMSDSLDNASFVINNLVDVRVRDGVLRTIVDWEVDKLQEFQDKLIAYLRYVNGVPGACLAAVVAGVAWILGDEKYAVKACGYSLDMHEISLARLLKRAFNAEVPLSVWVNAIRDVPMEECLRGVN